MGKFQSMSEYLSAILGKRKPKVEAVTDSSFTSYITSESNKEMSDFVVIDRCPTPAHYTDVPGTPIAQGFSSAQKSNSDYESLYSYVGRPPQPGIPYQPFGTSWAGNYSVPVMGAYPTKHLDASIPEASRPSSVISVKPVPLPVIINSHGDETQASTSPPCPSFLDGVPFRLSSSLVTAQNVRDMQNDSYNFLSSKASMLESLRYDFYLEQDVLQADGLTIQNCE